MNWLSRRRVKQAMKIVDRIDRYERKLTKFEDMVDKIKGWIKAEHDDLNAMLKELGPEEYDNFCEESGYMEDEYSDPDDEVTEVYLDDN